MLATLMVKLGCKLILRESLLLFLSSWNAASTDSLLSSASRNLSLKEVHHSQVLRDHLT